eukprot:1133884-Pelagomonas_calceolata.AAC.1
MPGSQKAPTPKHIISPHGVTLDTTAARVTSTCPATALRVRGSPTPVPKNFLESPIAGSNNPQPKNCKSEKRNNPRNCSRLPGQTNPEGAAHSARYTCTLLAHAPSEVTQRPIPTRNHTLSAQPTYKHAERSAHTHGAGSSAPRIMHMH